MIDQDPTVTAGTPAQDLDDDPWRATEVDGATFEPDAPGAMSPGRTLGRYILLNLIGEGGMGAVYAAYDPKLDRRVAVKVMHRERHRGEAERSGRRMMREAQAMARLVHPNVITVHDVGEADGRVFVAMEFVEGETLRGFMRRGPHPWPQVVERFRFAGLGLAAAHEAGLVHRDFKPENVLCGEDGRVQVVDFGLARSASDDASGRDPTQAQTQSGAQPQQLSTGMLGARMTETGAVMGTPAYMAPEQLRGQATDGRTDQYAFSVALYEALYGERPYRAKTVERLTDKVLRGQRSPVPTDADVPAWLASAVERGLSHKPDDRFVDMKAMLAAIRGPPRRWWRRPIGWIAAASLSAAAGLALLRPADPGEPQVCTGAEAKLAPVWNETRRAAAQQAFMASEQPYADHALEGSTRILDDYAAAWATAHHDACAATRIRGEQSEQLLDLRMICLQRRLDALDALAELLASADEQVVRNAVQASRRLPPLDPCADGQALLDDAPQLSAEQLEARAAVRKRLVRAEALRHSGKYAMARQLAEQLVDTLADGDDRQLSAEAHLVLSSTCERMGDYELAADFAKQGLWDAMRAHDDTLEAKASALLVTLEGMHRNRFEHAENWARHAEAVLARQGDPPRLTAPLQAGLGNLRYAEGRFAEALEHKKRALALRQADLAPDDPRLADLRMGVAVVLGALGRNDESLVELDAALTLRIAALGPLHPQTTKARNNLGNAFFRMGRISEAIEVFTEVRHSWRKTLGPDHPDVAMVENNLGNALGSTAEAAEAIPHYREAIRIWSATLGPDDVRIAYARGNLGRVLIGLGQDRVEEGIAEQHEALRIYEATVGEDHGDTLYPHINLAWGYTELGRFVEAERHAILAEERAVEARGRGHKLYADAREALALALRGQGRLEEALPMLEECVALLERIDARPAERAETRFWLAQVLAELHREPERAITLAEQARDEFERDDGGYATHRDEIDQWLAEHR